LKKRERSLSALIFSSLALKLFKHHP